MYLRLQLTDHRESLKLATPGWHLVCVLSSAQGLSSKLILTLRSAQPVLDLNLSTPARFLTDELPTEA